MSTETEVSGSIEMYLATIATLQAADLPVPLSHLAGVLSHSPVSVNEMCRKLVERGWAAYQPYKGVTLTSEGATLAEQVLCRRRLWEVFLVERLGADSVEAEAFACLLEHATPDDLARRLAAYLAYPDRSPQDEPIPCSYGSSAWQRKQTLSSFAVGQRGKVISVTAGDIAQDFLCAQGLFAGADLELLAASSEGVILIQTACGQLSISRSLADQVQVQPVNVATSSCKQEVTQ